MKKNLLISSFIFLSFLGFGQNLKSFNHVSALGFQEAFSIKRVGNGSYFLVSHFTGNLTLGASSFSSVSKSQDILVTFFNKYNTPIWSRQLGNTRKDWVTDVALDKNQQLVLAVSFYKSITAAPLSFQTSNDSVPENAVLVLDSFNVVQDGFKIDNQGSVGLKLATLPSGNLAIAGQYKKGLRIANTPVADANARVAFVAEVSKLGQVVWLKNLGTLTQTHDLVGVNTLVVSSNGDIYLGGLFLQSTTFGSISGIPQVLNSIGSADLFITKFSSSGELVWAQSLGSEGGDRFSDMALDKTGNPVLALGINGAMILNGQAYISAGEDAFVVELNQNNGQFLKKLFISEKDNQLITAITFDKDNNLYLAGGFIGTIDLANIGSTYKLSSINRYRSDLFFAKYDADWNLTWAQAQKGLGVEYIKHIEIDHNQQLYFSGLITNEMNFVTKSSSNYVRTLDMNSDIIFGKICMQDSINGCIEKPVITDLKPQKNIESSLFKLIPNPASQYVKIHFKSKETPKLVLIRDVDGKLIENIDYSRVLDQELSLSNYAAGVYFVTLVFEQQSSTLKLIVQK